MANIAGRFELGRHNRPATILRELEESRPPGALLRFVRLAALGSLRYARPPAAEAEAPAHTTRRGASMADEVQLTLAVCAPRAWGPPQCDARQTLPDVPLDLRQRFLLCGGHQDVR